MVDTNSNPNLIDFPIPGNDDASKSIALIIKLMAEAIEEGLNDRKMAKDKSADDHGDEDDSFKPTDKYSIEDEDEDKKEKGGNKKAGEGSRAKRPTQSGSQKIIESQ